MIGTFSIFSRFKPKYWVLSLLLITPAFIPYLTRYFIGIKDLVPTGFILDDSVYYWPTRESILTAAASM